MLSLSCLICTSWRVAVKKISSVELPVNPETIFNSSLRGIGIPSWDLGLHENFQAWRLWLCWRSSFAHLASPCTCGCKRQGKKEKKNHSNYPTCSIRKRQRCFKINSKAPLSCVCVRACVLSMDGLMILTQPQSPLPPQQAPAPQRWPRRSVWLNAPELEHKTTC